MSGYALEISLLEKADLDISVKGRGCIGFRRTAVSICAACGRSVLLRFLDFGVFGVCVCVHGHGIDLLDIINADGFDF